ncbi:MAG TPA: prephenate dehydratase, partial [Planctomycetota bacterium]|nr:prephenate dehydratase [Planctomycetota bacterium]
RGVVERVLALKDAAGRALRDPDREAAMRAALVEKGRARGLDARLVEALFDHVIGDSVRLQARLLVRRRNEAIFDGPLVVAYHGAPGSYSERAAQSHFGPIAKAPTYRGLETLRGVIAAVERGDARFGVLPIENTTAGSINETYDLLAATALSIVGEAIAPIEHCLAGTAQVPLASIRKVFSHPMALAQCADLLATLPGATPEPYYNTALAARKVKEDGDPTHAAIVSLEAAATYGLVVLRPRIADRADNFTRFVVVGREAIEVDPRVPSKTSLVMSTRHEEGALARCLAILAARHRNLTKLESRPRANAPWEYLFYLDFDGSTADPDVRGALEDLRGATTFMKVLGSYPVAEPPV